MSLEERFFVPEFNSRCTLLNCGELVNGFSIISYDIVLAVVMSYLCPSQRCQGVFEYIRSELFPV